MSHSLSSPVIASHREPRSERGIALIIALMAMMMLMALGTALILTTSTESKITRNFRNTSEGFYAADAVLERAMDDILTIHDWNNLLSGAAQSAFIDGPPAGTRTLADGKALDLGEIINDANCQKATACSASDLVFPFPGRPWGANNPVWKPFAWGFLRDITPTATVNSSFYVVAMVADDPSENDGNPLMDGVGSNPGSGVISMRAEAFGPFGAHKLIELTLRHLVFGTGGKVEIFGDSADYNNSIAQSGVRILSWREVR